MSFNPPTIEQEYFCHQHEADTKVFYHAKILDSSNIISAVVIDAEDTDVLVISAYASHILEKDVVLYKRNKLIKCESLCSAEMASELIGFHALTGADAVSGFYGHSKKSIYTKIQKNHERQQMLLTIGKNENISQIDINNAKKFVIKFMYSDKSSCNFAQARAKKWKQMKNKTTLQLPPYEDSFFQHMLRANYQAKIWYDFASLACPSSPLNHGYATDGQPMLPVQYTTDACPEFLNDFVLKTNQTLNQVIHVIRSTLTTNLAMMMTMIMMKRQ